MTLLAIEPVVWAGGLRPATTGLGLSAPRGAFGAGVLSGRGRGFFLEEEFLAGRPRVNDCLLCGPGLWLRREDGDTDWRGLGGWAGWTLRLVWGQVSALWPQGPSERGRWAGLGGSVDGDPWVNLRFPKLMVIGLQRPWSGLRGQPPCPPISPRAHGGPQRGLLR